MALRATVSFFHIVQISLELSIILLEEFFKEYSEANDIIIDSHDILMIIHLFQLFGLHNVFVHVIGMCLLSNFVKLPYDPILSMSLRAWICFATETCVIHVVEVVYSLRLVINIEDRFVTILKNGIKQYNTDMHWNVIWNNIQHSYTCCGVTGHHDWKNIIWLNPNDEQYFLKLNRTNKFLVPSSCCSQSKTLCKILHSTYTSSTLIEQHQINENLIFKNGCLHPLIWKMTGMFKIISILSIINIIIQFVIFILFRALFVRNRQYL